MAKKIPSPTDKTASETAAPQTLRVLIIDDSEDDALLLIRALKKDGYTPEYEIVETATAMSKALQDKTWDIILSDYKMPHFSGNEAIALLKETNIDIPLIIISGAIGEETAVECMRRGAHDFFIKGKLTRLPAAIARELGEAQSRKERGAAQKATITSELRFKELFENMTNCVAVYEAVADGSDFVFKDFNHAAELADKIDRKNVIGKSILEIFPGVREMGLLEVLQRIWKTGRSEHFPAAYYKDNRHEGWRENYIYKLPNGEVVVLYNDITERIKTERKILESEEKYRLLVENSGEVIFIAQDGMFKFINRAAINFFGSSYEVLTSNPFTDFIHPDDREMLISNHLRRLKGEAVPNMYTSRAIIADGTIHWVELHATVISWQGKPATLNFLTDITERRQAESQREAALEALRESEKKYRDLYDFLPIPIYEMDFAGNIISANRAIYETFRGTEEDLKKGFKVWQLTLPEEIEISRKNIQRLIDGEKISATEYTLMRLDGSFFPAIVISSVIYDKDKPVGLRGAVVDITERKQEEESLAFSNVLLRTQQEASIDGIVVVDDKGLILSFNQRFVDMWGIPRDIIESGSDERTLHWLTDKLVNPAEFVSQVKHLYKSRNEIIRDEIALQDGRSFDRYSAPMLGADEKYYGRVWYFRDITERKQMEQSLRKTQIQLQEAYRMAEIGSWSWNLNEKKITWSEEVYRMLGLPFQQLDFHDTKHPPIYSPESWELLKKSVNDSLKTGKSLQEELELVHPDGGNRWLNWIGGVRYDDQGIITGMHGTVQNITKRKRIEEALRQSEEKYRWVLNNMADVITVMDMNLRFTYVSPSILRIRGYTAEEAVAQTFEQIMTPESLQISARVFEEEMKLEASGKADPDRIHTVEVAQYRKDGSIVWMENHLSFMRDEAKKAVGIISVSHDVTDRRRAEEELRKHRNHLEELVEERTAEIKKINTALSSEIERRKAIEEALYIAKEQAEAANRSKSDFLANMSHELRTPLNSVIGFAEMLQNQLFGTLNEKQMEYTKFIFGSGKHLLNLINDILDLSKVEAGKMELSPQVFSLKEMLNGISMMFREKALNHGIHVSMEIADDVPAQINADERKLKQIMFNLLSNALKFTPDGGSVKITAEIDKDNNSVALAVADTGIGIKADDLPKIFLPFSQIESPYTKTKAGTGLGLAVTKRLVELHRGTIQMESEWGKGSKVTVRIPIK